MRHILSDSGARVLLVSNRRTFRHARPGVEAADTVERLVFFDDDRAATEDGATTLAEVERAGERLDAEDAEAFARSVAAIDADDLATIIYTSGTTGDPKGVMLTHHSFVSNVYAIGTSLPISPSDASLSVLPLSHIFERTVFYVF